jgi:hypothetical protein
MTEQTVNPESRIKMEIKGETLKAAMGIRGVLEKHTGKPISLSGVVRQAVREMYAREVEEVAAPE